MFQPSAYPKLWNKIYGNCTLLLENSVKCRIQFLNETDKSLFAESVLEDGTAYDNLITRAYDSTRAFAITLISATGQKAPVGVLFPERNDSFDFQAALDEFTRSYKAEKGLVENVNKPQASS